MYLVIAFLLIVGSIFPQDFHFERIGIEQGLSQSSITSITQDDRGFLWVGTWDGLNRFDGFSFIHFKHDLGLSTSIGNNSILNIQKGRKNELIIWSAGGGFSIFNTLSFSAIARLGYPSIATRDGILDFPVPLNDGIFVSSKTNLLKVSYPDFKISTRQKLQKEIVKVSGGEFVWVLGNDHIYKIDSEGNRERDYLLPKVNGKSLQFGYQQNIIKLNDSIALFSTYNTGLYVLNLNRGIVIPAQEYMKNHLIGEIKSASCIFVDSKARIWAGTIDGLFLISYNMGYYHTQKILHNKANPNSISANRVQSIYEDNEGIIWIGTTHGLNKLVSPKKTFSKFPSFSSSDDTPYAFLEEKDGLWWGTVNGLAHYNYKTNKTNRYTIKNSVLLSNFVYSLYKKANGDILIGTSRGLYIKRTETARIERISLSGEGLTPDFRHGIFCIIEDRNNILWLGTNHGIAQYNLINKNSMIYVPDSGSLKLGSVAALCLILKNDSTLYAGIDAEGLFQFDINNKKFTGFWKSGTGKDKLKNDKIMYMHKDRRGGLWCLTLGGGMFSVTEKEGELSFRRYGVKDGFADETMYGLVEDNFGDFWISSNKGLSRYNPITGRILNYTTADGLPANEFNQGAFHKGISGRLFFGSINGSVAFFPEEIRVNEVSPPVVITKFLVKNEDNSALLQEEEIILPYSKNFFSFEYIALSYNAPVKNQYAYKLEGFHDEWISSGNRRFANYTEVPPGKYIFRVKASNNSGVWNEEGASVTVVIVPPYWGTTWFRVLIALVFLVILTGIIFTVTRRRYKKRIEDLEKIKLVLEERQKIRDKIARDLHDDLASTVGGAGLYVESARNKMIDDPQLSLNYLEKTGILLREAEDAMSDIVWSVSPKFDTLPNLAARIHRLAGELCTVSGKKYIPSIQLLPDLPLGAEIRRNIYMIYKEAMNNVMRHSGADAVSLTILLKDSILNIELHDNGKGYVPGKHSTKGGGNGLENMRKRADEIKAELHIISDENAGTTIHLSKEITRLGY